MVLNCYAIYDNKALIYIRPFYEVTDGAALRAFQELAQDLNTFVGKHPNDYSLWRCATYDDQTGLYHPQVPLSHVGDASALLEHHAPLPLSGLNGGKRDDEVAIR